MEFKIIEGKYLTRPEVTLPDKGFLTALTEKGIRELVSNHYNLLIQSEAKHLFPPQGEALEKAKLRSSDFFIQICGGHPYYNENQGNPMMVKRHAPFRITSEIRIIWLNCYAQLLPNLPIDKKLILSFWNYINVFSIWMINTPDLENDSKQLFT